MSTEAYDSESPAAESESSGGEVKLYIGNLSWDMDDQSLNDLFSQYQASDCVIVTDPVSYTHLTLPTSDLV